MTSQNCGFCPARAVSKLYTILATCAVAWLLIALITRLPAALQVGRMNSMRESAGGSERVSQLVPSADCSTDPRRAPQLLLGLALAARLSRPLGRALDLEGRLGAPLRREFPEVCYNL